METDWDGDPDALTPDSGAARQAGDDAVEALAKVTAGMASGEQRPEQQEMCRAVGETLVTGRYKILRSLKSGTIVKPDNTVDATPDSKS